ncbi:MAG: ABC transporter permease [Deltaproteobacteria bacterium]|nr:ABC transporter permease [Deltaproteobacteria bacterium]
MNRLVVWLVAALVVMALVGPWLIGPEGLEINLKLDLKGLEAGRLGYGENGFDVLTWLIYGARVSLFIALTCTVISLVIGIAYGSISAYVGGIFDAFLMRCVDVLMAFPGILLALYIAAVLKPGVGNLIIALCSTGWVGYARVARSQVLAVKEQDFVMAAIALGASPFRVLFRHIVPNILGPLWVQASFGISALILAEASLSFLGLGVPIGTPSWGSLLEQGVNYLFVAPHLVILPGICIAVSVLLFNFLGDWLRDARDPQ